MPSNPGSSSPPLPDELEVSPFGPGVGECIVMHIGQGEWIVVDSCLDESGEPVAAKYLASMGVDVGTAVRLLVVTHWHDDHIGGASELFVRATSAKLAFSSALSSKEFLTLARLAKGRAAPREKSGAEEFVGLMGTLVQRLPPGAPRLHASPRWAIEGRVLYERTSTMEACRAFVRAVSPSDTGVTLANIAFADELERLKASSTGRRLVGVSPNKNAVALWVQAGVHRILLGSDLETSHSRLDGWNAVVAQHEQGAGVAGAMKVAHHGSSGADAPSVWSAMLNPTATSVVTPYRPSGLPRPADVARLSARGKLYITAPVVGAKPARRANAVERTIKETVKSRQLKAGRPGHVRLRAPLTGGELEVALFDGASVA